MKKTKISVARMLVLFLILVSCTADPRDDCCIGVDDRRDAPFTTTYLFQFLTGTRDIITPQNEQGLLKIISEADILTLKNAASTSQLKKNGLISGTIVGPSGPAREVNLQVTDRVGNILSYTSGPDRNLFFNSLGLVPDFLVFRGTGDEGTFTLFNVPPGELFFSLTSGGRGNGRIGAIESAVSIGSIASLPVYPDRVEVLGVILAESNGFAITDRTVSFFGNSEPVSSNEEGLFVLSVEEAIQTQGDFLIRIVAPSIASRDTTIRFDTKMNKVLGRQQAFDPLTANGLVTFSNKTLRAIEKDSGITLTPSMAIVTGRARAEDGTGKGEVTVFALDATGKPLSEKDGEQRMFYFKGGISDSGGLDPSLTKTTDNGRFMLFVDSCDESDLISLPSFGLTATVEIAVTVGRGSALCRPGGIFVEDLVERGLPGLASDPPQVTVAMSGGVFTREGQKVDRAEVKILGSSEPLTVAVDGNYRFEASLPGEVSPLLGSSDYTFRVALDENYLPTYQSVFTGATESSRRLTLLASDLRDECLPTGDINFLGRALDLGLLVPAKGGRTLAGLSFEVVEADGTVVGRVVYPEATSETSISGEFIVCDLPGPGIYQVRTISEEDSGAVLVHNYSDGVHLFDVIVNQALPRDVRSSGKVVNLLEAEVGVSTPLADAVVKVHGLAGETLVDASGDFSLTLGTNGRYILQVDKEGQLTSHNYHVSTPVQGERSTIDTLQSISREDLDRIAAQASLVQVEGLGLVAGKAVILGLSDVALPLSAVVEDAVSVLSGFYNDDSHPDTLVISSSGLISHFLGNGEGAVEILEPACPSLGLSPDVILVADFDLNGRVDLAVISGDRLFIFVGNSEGCFDDPEEITEVTLEGKPKAMSLADLNADGLQDLLVATDNDAPLIRLASRGDGTFEAFKMEGRCGTQPVEIVARFGNGGLMDIILADAVAGICSIGYEDSGAAEPTKMLVLPEAFQGNPIEALKVAFLAGGVDRDVMVLFKQGAVIFIGAPPTDPTITSISFSESFGFPDNFDIISVKISDLSRDNRNDMIVGGSAGLFFFLGNGDGTFGLSATLSTLPSPFFTFQDLDEDGLIDLVASQEGNLNLFEGGNVAQADVKVEVRDREGFVAGDILYLDEFGQLLPEADSTGSSGRFLVLNVPVGRTQVKVIQGGAGNNLIETFKDSLSYLHLGMNRLMPESILLDGQVINPTSGATSGIAVDNVKITPLASGLEALSVDIFDDPETEDVDESRRGSFQLQLGAASEYILKLDPQKR